jgi:hypothetical protein
VYGRGKICSEVMRLFFSILVFDRKDIIIAFAPTAVINGKLLGLVVIYEMIIQQGNFSLVMILNGDRLAILNIIFLKYPFKRIATRAVIYRECL